MAWEGRSRGLETVNRIVVSGLVFGPVEFTEPDRGPAHARFCLSQEKAAGSRRVEHRFHCVAFGPVAMAVAASLAPASPWCSRGASRGEGGNVSRRPSEEGRGRRAERDQGIDFPQGRRALIQARVQTACAFFIPRISIHTHVRICAYTQPHIFVFAYLCVYASAHLGRYRRRMRAWARDG